jgi:hypothetical protein
VQARRAVRGTSLAILGLALNECPDRALDQPDLTHLARNAFPRLTELAAVENEDPDALWDLVIESLITGLAVHTRTRR